MGVEEGFQDRRGDKCCVNERRALSIGENSELGVYSLSSSFAPTFSSLLPSHCPI
jgi:hypothetical protein